MTVNAAKCNEVADAILANPYNFNMSMYTNVDPVKHDFRPDLTRWPHRLDYALQEAIFVNDLIEQDKSLCGTSGCIAGWTVFITPPEEYAGTLTLQQAAQDLLGLNEQEAETLFLRSIEELHRPEAAAKALRLIGQGYTVAAAVESASIEFPWSEFDEEDDD